MADLKNPFLRCDEFHDIYNQYLLSTPTKPLNYKLASTIFHATVFKYFHMYL